MVIDIYNDENKSELAEVLASKKSKVYVCIGTEKVFADSLGPRVGTLLNENMSNALTVYGMRGRNITAENLVPCMNFVKKMHPNNTIVVIDAAVGDKEQIGEVQVSDGGIVPGAATNKNLPKVGDVSIVGIVAERGMADFYTSNSEKDLLVSKVANFITQAILMSEAQLP